MEDNDRGTGRYLVFVLGAESYAIDVSSVEVVLEYAALTRVPRSPDHIRGVINHRGSVIPVVDLRRRLSLPQPEESVQESIIVTQVDFEGEQLLVGLLADSVQEVVVVDPATVEAAPSLGSLPDAAFVEGIARRGEDFVILLDIEAALREGNERPGGKAEENR